MANAITLASPTTDCERGLADRPGTARVPRCLSVVPVLLALLAACSPAPETLPGSEGRRSAPVLVVPHQVSYRPEQKTVEAVGTARARKTATIYAETGGEVVLMPFQTGALVAEADVIVQLEAREEQLAVSRAKIAVKDAEQLLDRYRRIDVPGAISDSQIDEAQTALDAARIELQIAENALAERTVRAPFDGHLGLSSVDPGSRITPATEIAQLDDRTILFVEFNAPEQVFGRIDVGDYVTVTPFSDQQLAYQAEVLALGGSIDPATRAFVVRTRIDNSNDELRPGMSFKVTFAIQGARYPAIPEAAIVWGSDGAYLWSVEEGLAKRVSVTIVARTEGMVLVKAELAEGSIVIAQGVHKVREGRQVTFDSPLTGTARGAR